MPDPTIITQVSSAESQLDGNLLLYLMGLPLSHYPPCCGLNSTPKLGYRSQLHLFGAIRFSEVVLGANPV